MTLGQKQRLFTKLMAEWTLWVYEQGYELSDGDAYRDPRLHGMVGVKKGYGHKNSGHKRRLARDYNLFKDEKWLDRSEDHRPLGENWESRHELCRWGGRFGDGNHYSFIHDGVR